MHKNKHFIFARVQVLCVSHSIHEYSSFLRAQYSNSAFSRVAIYINNSIDYIRREDLEGIDSNLMIIDLAGINKIRIINVYRSFSPQHYIGQRDKFNTQLLLIKAAITLSTLILGDFNLDWSRRFDASYAYFNYFEDLDLHLGEFGLNQMVSKPTWAQTINGIFKDSILDHIYLSNPLSIGEVIYSWQSFTDHS